MGQAEFSYLQTAFLYVYLPMVHWFLVILFVGCMFAAVFILFGGLFRHLSR